MKNQIKSILENEIASPTKVDQFNRNHIFYDIKNIVIKSSDKQSIADLYYCFSLYEKCLSLARGNNLDLAGYWLHKIKQAHSNIPNELLQYLKILYTPCLAFYYYKRENYSASMELLSSEMNHIDMLLADNKALKLEMKLEQIINKYRILHSSKNYETSVSLATNIIDFVINNKKFNDVEDDSIHWVADGNPENYRNWVTFLVNNVVSKIELDNEMQEKEKEMIYYAIFGSISSFQNSEFIELDYSFKSLKNYYQGDIEKFLENVSKAFQKIHKLPINIQRILLNCLIKSKHIDPELGYDYMTKVLKIKLPVYQ
ncbi:hypothetical protein [Chryseobacterium balustinum]|uniref:Uncharacterized protein n=1 Tax=Chryseobacterium balustinum TaxID=246 RepID=A0AAX2IPX8_9FLAO|nr:hypothetical protein [Chryseobacterium balustinum]AZB28676.1 hypothetical protein EB354_05045 [Chryseobacterium balustinum]SKC06830.1 hypothetical protein SAMN05421800_12614 [Chryseobacterium balustinum]SQA91810.1 Uncharacterised protein [Chryseobacterium balustinum]